MERYEFPHEGKIWRRVSKAKARRHYDAGLTVQVIACKLVPFSMWGFGYRVNKNESGSLIETGTTFNDVVLNYQWYNCNYETGYYAAFYVADGGKL